MSEDEKQRVRMTELEYLAESEAHGGLCLACGELTGGGCEPDAERYPCEGCGARQVYGLELCLLMGLVSFAEEEE